VLRHRHFLLSSSPDLMRQKERLAFGVELIAAKR